MRIMSTEAVHTHRRLLIFCMIFSGNERNTDNKNMRMETKIDLQDNNYTLMHLPLYYSKRRIYEKFSFISEWEVKAASDSSYPPVTEF